MIYPLWKWQQACNNPKIIEIFWEGVVLRTAHRFLFGRALKKVPENITYAELCAHLTRIEQTEGRRYALWLLSRRSLLSSELREKLCAKGISSESAAQICLALQGYLDDTEQLQRLIASERRKGRSNRAIYAKLTQTKGADPALLRTLLPSSDLEALDRYLAKHAKKVPREKLMQKLFRLGFAPDLIRSRIDN